MQTLEINVPDNKTQQVKEFLAALGVTVKAKNKKKPQMRIRLLRWMS